MANGSNNPAPASAPKGNSNPAPAKAPASPATPAPASAPVAATPAPAKVALGPKISTTLLRSYDPAKTTVNLLQPSNPKRGASQRRYTFYVHGQTIAQLIATNVANGYAAADAYLGLAWDMRRNYVSLNVVMPQVAAPATAPAPQAGVAA